MNTTLLSYFCCLVSVVFYGSNYVVVKKFPTGDGMFFQFTLTLGIFLTALFLEFLTNPTHQFYPFAMLGGMIWATGNLLTVPVIQTIGVSLGISIWGISNLAIGWCTGTFGLFGINAQPVDKQILNCIGAALACISVPFYGFIKSMEQKNIEKMEEIKEKENKLIEKIIGQEEKSLLLANSELKGERAVQQEINEKEQNESQNEETNQLQEIKSEEPQILVQTDITSKPSLKKEQPKKYFNFFDYLNKLNPVGRRIIGVVLALITGLFFGSNFTPPQYLIDNNFGPNTQYCYLFSHACGIFVTASIYFICYSIISTNKPTLYPETFLPGIVSGIIWEIAQICFMYSNTYLPWSVTFSINASGPGLVSTLWGIFVFGEIRGIKNYLLFICGVATLSLGIVCVVLSR
ncbi:transmembrane protein 144 family protein [Entamoeba histolytica HM-3:IMSS]|uniref:Transmembrane protein, putative n=2 Tax=Entamoeba histolytica TaxID=5759 RepID=M2Q176_ENTHI|nr:transmembrane protein, putative [Entamoeba histolytica KU27]EMS11275.1 transmembrane protein 144 family protein [Entamoeba histolytica HM-3:IMSS]